MSILSVSIRHCKTVHCSLWLPSWIRSCWALYSCSNNVHSRGKAQLFFWYQKRHFLYNSYVVTSHIEWCSSSNLYQSFKGTHIQDFRLQRTLWNLTVAVMMQYSSLSTTYNPPHIAQGSLLCLLYCIGAYYPVSVVNIHKYIYPINSAEINVWFWNNLNAPETIFILAILQNVKIWSCKKIILFTLMSAVVLQFWVSTALQSEGWWGHWNFAI